jgi:hypothetical protein
MMLQGCFFFGDDKVVVDNNETNITQPGDSASNPDAPLVDENEETTISGYNAPSFRGLVLGDATIKEIGSAHEKSSYESEALSVVGSSDTNLSNVDTPISVEAGKFYYLEVAITTGEEYSDGLGFDLELVTVPENQDEEITSINVGSIGKGEVDLSAAGEHAIPMEISLPASLSAGKYMLVVSTSEADLERLASEGKEITQVAEIGALYLDVMESSDPLTLSFIDVNGSNYVDLPYITTFVEGYSKNEAGASSLTLHNSSSMDENITLSATLSLEDGTTITLGILDTDDSKVKEGAVFEIELNDEESDSGESEIVASYHIPESEYAVLIEKLPDMSVDENSDGIKATIRWSMVAQNGDLVTNTIEESVMLSKFLGDFKFGDDSTTQANSKYRALLEGGSILDAIKDDTHEFALTNLDTREFEQEWTSISEIPNMPFKTIDAAVSWDGEVAYLFSGDKVVTYSIATKEVVVGSESNISTLFSGVTFKSLDAVTYRKGKKVLYFFSGEDYVRYDIGSAKVDDGYPKQIADEWDGMFEEIDAAYQTEAERTYFFSGTEYSRYSYSSSSVMSGYPKEFSGDWGGNPITAATALDDDTVIRFRDPSNTPEKRMLQDGIFFKYSGEFNKVGGKKKRVAVAFENSYSIEGLWQVPGVNAQATSNLNFYIVKKPFTLLGLEAQAAISVAKKFQGLDPNSDAKSRVGGIFTVKVLNYTYYEKDTMSEEDATEELSADATEAQKRAELDSAKTKSEGKSFEMPNYEWKEEKTLISTIVPIGPVPVSVEAGVSGSIAIETGFGFDGVGVALTASTPIEAAAFMEGGINVVIFKAGVRGDATLLETSGDASLGAYLDLVATDLVFKIASKVSANFSILRGKLYLYAKWRAIKWCWGAIPCGLKWKGKKFKIYKSKWLYSKEWDLLDVEVPLLKLPLK